MSSTSAEVNNATISKIADVVNINLFIYALHTHTQAYNKLIMITKRKTDTV